MENAEFPMLLQGVPTDERRVRISELFVRTGMHGLEDRRPGKLSGGQQQRVAVVRAVASKPALVLADEPTANLDSAASEALLDVMAEFSKELGVTFVFATHDARVMDRSQRLVRMVDGRIDTDENSIFRRINDGRIRCLLQQAIEIRDIGRMRLTLLGTSFYLDSWQWISHAKAERQAEEFAAWLVGGPDGWRRPASDVGIPADKIAVVLSTERYHLERADMVVVGLTSNISTVRYGDHVLNDWRSAGLPLPTKAKAVLETVQRTAAKNRLGVLSPSDLSGVELVTREALGL